MKKGILTIRIILLIVLMGIIESFADLFMKKGLISTGISSVGFHNLLEFISGNALSILIWFGILMYIINFLIWLTVLSKVQLSIAFPVVSVSYIFAPIPAIVFLNENVGFLRWLGIASIIAGIYFLSRSSRKEAVKRRLAGLC